MRASAIVVTLLLAAAPATLAAQATDSSSRGTKPDTTPAAPGTCVDRGRERKCDRPEKQGDRVVRKVGEVVAPIARGRVSREKGGTRGDRDRGLRPPRPGRP